jgi:hypothetical protein
MFGLAKHHVNCSLGAYDDFHKLNYVNLSRMCVAIPPSQPNNVNNLHIHWQACNSYNMLLIDSQGGLEVIKIVSGDGILIGAH